MSDDLSGFHLGHLITEQKWYDHARWADVDQVAGSVIVNQYVLCDTFRTRSETGATECSLLTGLSPTVVPLCRWISKSHCLTYY